MSNRDRKNLVKSKVESMERSIEQKTGRSIDKMVLALQPSSIRGNPRSPIISFKVIERK